MNVLRLAAVLAASTLLASAANAGVILNDAGGRLATVNAYDPIGQSFVAIDNQLTSIGFQFSSLNPAEAIVPVVLNLYAGSGFGGSLLATRTFTPATLPARNLPFVFLDTNFAGTALSIGQTYTIGITSSSNRLAVAFGPNVNGTPNPNGLDPYAAGRLFTSVTGLSPCDTQACDLNFRVTGSTVAAVPEPATWAMMIGGFGLVGGAMRRRVGRVALA